MSLTFPEEMYVIVFNTSSARPLIAEDSTSWQGPVLIHHHVLILYQFFPPFLQPIKVNYVFKTDRVSKTISTYVGLPVKR